MDLSYALDGMEGLGWEVGREGEMCWEEGRGDGDGMGRVGLMEIEGREGGMVSDQRR